MQLDEHRSYNALALILRGDYHALKKAFNTHGSWAAAYEANNKKRTVDPEKSWQELIAKNITLLLNTDESFPELLREIPWPPHALYLSGSPLIDEPKIAIVGTRKATPLGVETAEKIARECSLAKVTIVSGLAFGIDVAAHQATLTAGGRAIAVLASGLDRITPRSNEQVGKRIIENGGTLISEYPIGALTLPRFFIERNRIVSGLSLGIVVIEAPTRSGTLSTARFAVDQNREVFVVPGAINNPNYEGSHALIKSGASLITEASDVLDALDLLPKESAQRLHTQPLPFLDETGARIVEVLSAAGAPLAVDAIAERTKLGIAVLNEALALLTIEGVVRENGSAYYI
jgi:DNA processing protein